jgi:DNA polymerase-1
MFGDDVMAEARARPMVTPKSSDTKVTLVQDEAALQALVANLKKARIISFDTEATSTDPLRAALVGIALAIKEGEGYYIPIGHEPPAEQLPLGKIVKALKPIGPRWRTTPSMTWRCCTRPASTCAG